MFEHTLTTNNHKHINTTIANASKDEARSLVQTLRFYRDSGDTALLAQACKLARSTQSNQLAKTNTKKPPPRYRRGLLNILSDLDPYTLPGISSSVLQSGRLQVFLACLRCLDVIVQRR